MFRGCVTNVKERGKLLDVSCLHCMAIYNNIRAFYGDEFSFHKVCLQNNTMNYTGWCNKPCLEALSNTSGLSQTAKLLYLPKAFTGMKQLSVCFAVTKLGNILFSKLLLFFRVFCCNVYFHVLVLAVN